MRPLLCALTGLALFRAAGSLAAAEPFSPPRGDSAQSTVCDRHMAVQRRLDVMEEMASEPWSWSPAAGGSAPARQHPQNQPCPLAFLPSLASCEIKAILLVSSVSADRVTPLLQPPLTPLPCLEEACNPLQAQTWGHPHSCHL
ncbi:uncharacterized protein LOC116463925 isoform X1 [Hylobates moloch]|uniref:uncharacterized protein LOC116463925 isoform X1 n=1 Tax=Hylobates moloch TaxID=81572 RepID=UPI001362FBCF|nr:uncharacterized protein LOC116463925 isoform X1 [Hylobates moloch]